jgi:hypothetical protein
LAPTGLANVMKAGRRQMIGESKRNGDQTFSPEEITLLDTLGQAIGLPTNKITDRQFRQGALIETEQNLKDRSSTLKKEYTRAYKSGNFAGSQQARDEWRTLQETRRRYGFNVQPMSALLKAPQEQAKRERDTARGIQFRAGNRGFVESEL